MGRIRRYLAERLRLRRRDPERSSGERREHVDSVDGIASAGFGDYDTFGSGGAPPPGWVKSYDEGRPRK